MRYIDYVEQHIKIATWSILAAFISYTITCRLGWREPIDFSIEFITTVAWMTICFTIGGSYFRWYVESRK